MYTKILISGLLASTLSASALAQSTPPAPDRAPAATTAPIAHAGQWRASKLIGVNVYNEQNEKLGDINEVLVDKSGKVSGVVVGVGGFLGIGEHDILVSLDKIKFVNEPMRSSATTNTTSTNSAARAPGNTATATSTRAARDANEKWYPDHAVMSGTKDQLKAMPQFKYSSYN